MLQRDGLERGSNERGCVEWWQPSHSSTCGGTDWTCCRAFWLPWRPSVSWQMAASKRRAPGRPQLPLIGSPCTHNTPHAHMHRLVAYEQGGGEWRTWLFWSWRCQASWLLLFPPTMTGHLQNKLAQSGSNPLLTIRQSGWIHGGTKGVSVDLWGFSVC